MDADKKEKLRIVKARGVFKDAQNCIGAKLLCLAWTEPAGRHQTRGNFKNVPLTNESVLFVLFGRQRIYIQFTCDSPHMQAT